MPLEVLLGVGRFDPARLETNLHAQEHCSHGDPECREHHRDHSRQFGTWSYETDRPLSLAALWEAARRLPADIYRAKGG